MDEKEFCRWLQGYCELNGDIPTEQQWEAIKKHLQLCYHNVTKYPKTAYINSPTAKIIC